MAGTKGHSGGARDGAGRKATAQAVYVPPGDPADMAWHIACNQEVDIKVRLDAIKALLAAEKKGKKQTLQQLSTTAEIGTDWEGLLAG